MRSFRVAAIIGLAVLFGFSGSAAAQNAGGLAVDLQNQRGAAAVNGPVVGGNVTSTVNVGNVNAEAEDGSVASNRIGSVTSGSVGGNVTSRVNAGNVNAEAKDDSCAENVIASVGSTACDKF